MLPAPLGRAPSTAPASPGSSEPASSTEGVRKPVRKEIKKFLGDLVDTVGHIVHRVGTFGNEPERQAGVWIPTLEQIEDIAEPATALVMEHVPARLLQSAVVNGLRMLLGVAGYTNAHLDTKAQIRVLAGNTRSSNPQARGQRDVTGEINAHQAP